MKPIKSLKKIAITLFLPTALMLTSGVVVAKEKKYPYEDGDLAIPEMLSYLEGSGGEVHAKFRVNEHLNGFAVSINNDRLIVYATADGSYVFNGSLLDKKADDLTVKFAKKYLPKTEVGSQLKRIEDSSFVSTHKTGADRRVYVIHDPNCGFCKQAHTTIMSYPHAKVDVRWIPVGALGKDSAEKAAVILGNKSINIQDDFNKGYALTDKESPMINEQMQAVIENTRLMKYLGIGGTPAFIVVDNGEITNLIQGNRQGDIIDMMNP